MRLPIQTRDDEMVGEEAVETEDALDTEDQVLEQNLMLQHELPPVHDVHHEVKGKVQVCQLTVNELSLEAWNWPPSPPLFVSC